MEIQYLLADPTKNITVLVTTPVSRALQPELASLLLDLEPEAEQVGFVETAADGQMRLQMMGGEFCGNATRAFACYAAKVRGWGETRLAVSVSGAREPVPVAVDLRQNRAYAQMPLPYALEWISVNKQKIPLVRMEVTCSKGTYIRTLCHDIGEKLGCHGCMEQLIRTRVGQFDRNGAHTLDEIAAIVGEGRLSEILVPVDEMFAALRSFATADDHAKKLAENGNPLKPAQIREIGETASGGDFAEDEEFRLYLDGGTFVGIYQYRPSQNLTRPVKLFLERT